MKRNALVKVYKGVAPSFMPLTSGLEIQPHLPKGFESYIKVGSRDLYPNLDPSTRPEHI